MATTRNGGRKSKVAQSSPNARVEAGATQHEPITRETIAEEVTRAIQAVMPSILDQFKEITHKMIEDKTKVEKEALSKYKLAEFDLPEFREAFNPIAAMRWINEMENIFDAIKCADENKVVYAVAMLKSEALYWWNAVKDTSGPKTTTNMTWSRFKEMFKKKFCPTCMVMQLEQELLNFKQGELKVKEYTVRFLELASVVKYLVDHEDMRIDWYVRGLNYNIRQYIFVSHLTKFEVAVELALDLENSQNREFEEENDLKRKRQEPESETCTNCRKFHKGECRHGSRKCYRCGEVGHFVRDCPLT